MLVYLHQYDHEEADFDDNRTVGESQTEDSVNKDSEEYFGANVDQFDAETWETVEYDGDPVQRRNVTISGVTAVSVPQEPTDEDDPSLPGRTIQLRLGGGIEFLDQAVFVEAQDEEPQDEEPQGKVSKEEDPQGKAPMDEEP